MKAIWTKYLGPTNSRGSRIKASAEGVSVTVPYADELSGAACHAVGALALCRKMGWPGDLISGGRPDGVGWVFVFAEGERHKNVTPTYAEQAEARKAKV